MKLGTGSNAVRTQKYASVKVQNDIRTSKYIKKTSGVLDHKWRASLIVR